MRRKVNVPFRYLDCAVAEKISNLGHGYENLSTVLMHLMMPAFLIDQIQQRCFRLFQAALAVSETKRRFWRKLGSRFDLCMIPDRETPYRAITQPPPIVLAYDTS